ncbi:septum formation family protein [Cellulomonas bogoriensis]|uniref:Septum formation-related domain-containing protein n=1 Tax=Cellulomonas bogoriensis 69B4 = DSM 16987 TaxID=1386082 RepID=A0A0A0BQP5_9CELL|nr:septum formation family protein [Cellulomonas bogoriensis]KGM10286.1 hypothetical protein N869_04965 [Cellulomonas bogoriensis 69B4 = DSM 16987]
MTTPHPEDVPQEPYYAPGWAPQQQGEPRPPLPRWPLWTAAVVAGVSLLAGLGFAVRYAADLRSLGEVDGATTAHVRQLERGHCVEDLPQDGAVTRVRVVPCEDPHRAEVLGTYQFREDVWPGAEEAERRVAAGCQMDSAQRQAGAEPVVWFPSEGSWRQGDRLGVCLAQHPEPVRGSWGGGDSPTP